MGFPEAQARNALQRTGGNLERAVDSLLSGGDGIDSNINGSYGSSECDPLAASSRSVSAMSNDSFAVVRGSTSQYSYGSDGRSACTCIALAAAEIVASASTTNDHYERSIITSSFLDQSIEKGVSRYSKLRNALGSSASSVEHLSADEVLLKDDELSASSNNDVTGDNRLFGVRLKLIGGGQRVHQGALSRDRNHPLGMKSVLGGLVRRIREEQQQDAREGNSNNTLPMICILLTKTPETVLLCLPSVDDGDAATTRRQRRQQQQHYYWLIDSHPRPNLLPAVEAGYAKPHGTLDALLQTLSDIFPFTDLGPGIPPMMSDMYNMFDLSALEGRKQHETSR